MTNYNYVIEGGLHFYEELYKSLDDDKNVPNEKEKHDISGQESECECECCLISGMPLIEHSVTLDCKHSFNYVPLFKYMKNYREKFSQLESKRINTDEIKCPYCRTIQKGILPYYDDIGVEKFHGINWLNPELLVVSSSHCSWCHNGEECNSFYLYNNVHDNKLYCSTHLKKMKQIKKKDDKLQAQEDAKLVKIAAKELKEAARLLAKKMKAEKKNAGKKKVQQDNVIDVDENVIISDSSPVESDTNTCSYKLTSGFRVGLVCGCKANHGGYCKRHFNIMNKPIC
jgi:hypothetical protein